MKKQTRVYEDIENRGCYVVENALGPVEALMKLEIEYPEIKGKFIPKMAREISMRKCLDCESFWSDEDGICGECSEMRLSKREIPAYWICKN